MKRALDRILKISVVTKMEGSEKDARAQDFRVKSMRAAINVLMGLTFEIQNSDQLQGIPHLGEGTRRRVQEILDTGDLTELHEKSSDKRIQEIMDLYRELTSVTFIGDKTARILVKKHHVKSVKDLKKRILSGEIKVNPKILMGLKYYGKLGGRIPRAEATEMLEFVKRIAWKIDPDLEMRICGSYRRGRPDSGDVDILVWHPEIRTKEDYLLRQPLILRELVEHLQETGLILDSMTDKNYSTKYLCFARLPGHPIRRMDLVFTPANSLAASLLYFTGPDSLNVEMRNRAIKRNGSLSEHGLFLTDMKTGVTKNLNLNSERAIFRALGMEYLTPQERDQYRSKNE